MDFKKLKKILIISLAVFLIFAAVVYAISFEQFSHKSITGYAPDAESIIAEISSGTVIKENITAEAEYIDKIEIMAGTYDRVNEGELSLTISNSENSELLKESFDISLLNNNSYTVYNFKNPLKVTKGENLTVVLKAENLAENNSFTIYAGDLLSSNGENSTFILGGETLNGTLCLRLSGYNNISFYIYYWVIILSLVLISALYVHSAIKKVKTNKPNLLSSIYVLFTRYSFLIKQLVSRDVKTKYKRSVLGMAWSVMNPLLSMGVQYFIFSTVFNSNIPNYPVYLLTGIVFFNFFTEALTMGMTAIISNAPLIKKVYMPKYIYPVTRVISSLVNFLCALIPLLLMIILTGTAIKPAIFLLVFDIIFYLLFIIGLTLILATAMTFFQDTQFLWGIISLMWQYVTPIFYPESIIPEIFLPIYRLNPMYQYITFARTCVIDGVSPEPASYFACIASALIFLIAGILIFKKNQNKFVLYL